MGREYCQQRVTLWLLKVQEEQHGQYGDAKWDQRTHLIFANAQVIFDGAEALWQPQSISKSTCGLFLLRSLVRGRLIACAQRLRVFMAYLITVSMCSRIDGGPWMVGT